MEESITDPDWDWPATDMMKRKGVSDEMKRCLWQLQQLELVKERGKRIKGWLLNSTKNFID